MAWMPLVATPTSCSATPFDDGDYGRDNPNPLLLTEFTRPSCYQFLRVIEHGGSNPPLISMLYHGSSLLELHRCIRFRSQGRYLTRNASHRPLV